MVALLTVGFIGTVLLGVSLVSIPVMDALNELGKSPYRRRVSEGKGEYQYYATAVVVGSVWVTTGAIIILMITDFHYLLVDPKFSPSVVPVLKIAVVVSWVTFALSLPILHFKKLERTR